MTFACWGGPASTSTVSRAARPSSPVTGKRTWGELDRPLILASVHAWPVVSATYLGVAEGLVDRVLASPRVGPEQARLVGLLDAHIRTARRALRGVVEELGDHPDLSFDNLIAVQQMKRIVAVACQETAVLAAEVAGGSAYAKRGAVDRMTRDLRAAIYHPYSPEATLTLAGRTILGLDQR